ncbi:BON domain-containing protein [Dyella subtropica]|uniref:BON domain-containing protein n=1 Tax=Dyella subtropica TaxID=2992127 RepID=UPI00224D64A2|nr:BON domain-containing protein [Dyella subtropica]
MRIADHSADSRVGVHWLDLNADNKLSQAVRGRLADDPMTRDAKLSVHSDEGHVMLTGFTTNPEVLAKALTLTLDTPGVSDVHSGVTVAR